MRTTIKIRKNIIKKRESPQPFLRMLIYPVDDFVEMVEVVNDSISGGVGGD